MKYIGNAFSWGMIEEDSVKLRSDKITRSQFCNARKHAKSIMGHPELAEYFDVPYNRESIRLKPGDMLYLASPHRRYKENEVVYMNGPRDDTPFDPENVEFTFRIIQILRH